TSIVPQRIYEIPDHAGKHQRLKKCCEVDEADHHQGNDEQPCSSSFYPDLTDVELGACHRYNFSKYNGLDQYFWHKVFPGNAETHDDACIYEIRTLSIFLRIRFGSPAGLLPNPLHERTGIGSGRNRVYAQPARSARTGSPAARTGRSEERRAGKEGRYAWRRNEKNIMENKLMNVVNI